MYVKNELDAGCVILPVSVQKHVIAKNIPVFSIKGGKPQFRKTDKLLRAIQSAPLWMQFLVREEVKQIEFSIKK